MMGQPETFKQALALIDYCILGYWQVSVSLSQQWRLTLTDIKDHTVLGDWLAVPSRGFKAPLKGIYKQARRQRHQLCLEDGTEFRTLEVVILSRRR